MISRATPSIGFISLGCPKALVDSERIMTQLRIDGYELVGSYHDADAVVVNTCGFIDSAKAESLETIGEALKENGKVFVTGCLGVHENEIRDAHPDVLSVTGPHQYEAIVGAVREHFPVVRDHDPKIDLVPQQGIKLTPRHYAYLKISEGCNHKCSFCIIPSMRGGLLSRPIEEVLNEAQGLVESGVQELLVISQDTSAYGSDRRYRTGFWNGKPVKGNLVGLCEGLAELGVWVRLHYVYPYPHVDNVIPLMADRRILPYLDIPFQHGSPRILKLMRRPAHAENVLERITRWRAVCPEITLRSTFIVGFPGESDEDFEILLDFIEEADLDRVGCFQYSAVAGAAANELPGAVSEHEKQQRYDAFMQTQQTISRARLQRRVGQSMEVLIDEIDDGQAIGRTWADAPEIDGLVYLSLNDVTPVSPGERHWATIESADDYDLYGVINTDGR